MITLKERNGCKNIISNDEKAAFAWAAYYANKSFVYINSVKYFVDIVFNGSVVFSDNRQTDIGNWVIFKNISDNKIIVYDKARLNQLRHDNPITGHVLCLSDEAFKNMVA